MTTVLESGRRDGLLNIDKPAGMTSHDVVARVRRILKIKRVGHAGTLDPDATGVLVVAVGQATRLLPHLPLEPKEYVARVVFGAATTTEDASGEVTEEADASSLTQTTLDAALPRFIGEIDQIPPMVSAVHHEGRRLYELARQGVTVERQPRRVTVYAVELQDFVHGERAEATLRVVCGGGTYIRTLCADLGAAVGLPAHMKTLVREAVGPYRREDALSLDTLMALGEGSIDLPDGRSVFVPMERALGLPTRDVSDEDAKRLLRGQWIQAAAEEDASLLEEGNSEAALLYNKRLFALARYRDGAYHPFKVFGKEEEETD